MVELDNREVMVIGGSLHDTILNSTEVFDGTKWAQGPPLNRPRSSVTAVQMKSRVYAIGGKVNRPREYSTEIEVLEGSWSILPVQIPVPVISVGAVAWEDQLIIFGGQDQYSNMQQCPYIINTLTNSFVGYAADLPKPQKYPTTHAVAANGVVFCVAKLEAEVYAYDMKLKTWRTLQLHN
jgi:hypothetical protein